MLRSFTHKGLAELWETGRTSRIDKRMHARILRRLDVLIETEGLSDLASMPGFDFHTLKGFDPPLHNPRQRPVVHHDRVCRWRRAQVNLRTLFVRTGPRSGAWLRHAAARGRTAFLISGPAILVATFNS